MVYDDTGLRLILAKMSKTDQVEGRVSVYVQMLPSLGLRGNHNAKTQLDSRRKMGHSAESVEESIKRDSQYLRVLYLKCT